MPTSPRENASVLPSLGLGIFGLLLSLIVLELLFRLFLAFSPHQSAEWNDRPAFYFKAEGGPTMQDYVYPDKKPEGGFRVAVVGDSFTFGPHMQFDDTFPKQLERMLNMGKGPAKAEVMNLGVCGYSTKDEINLVKDAIQKGADMVILQITLNDPELQLFQPKGGKKSLFGPLEINDHTNRLYYYWKSLGFVASRLHNMKSRKAYEAYFRDLFENPKTWENFTSSVAKIAELTKNSHTKFAAVVFPLFSYPFDDNYPLKDIHDKIAALLNEDGIPFLDLRSSYAGIPNMRLQVMPPEDLHPNEIAHRIAAEKIYSWLVSKGYVPETFTAKELFNRRTENKPFHQFRCDVRSGGSGACEPLEARK